MIPSFESGAILLEDGQGIITRLSWDDPRQKERRRFVPPGKYRVRGYRLYRADNSGREWIISATGPHIKDLVVAAGTESKVTIDETIALASGLKATAGKVDVMMSFSGEGHSGLTVYADGARIRVNYAIVSSAGEELAKGPMNYG